MALYQDSGQSPERRLEEGKQLVKQLEEVYGLMDGRDLSFYESMSEQLADGRIPSPKQLFWLRDIKEKLL